jgi:hypothetical protein
MQSVNYWTSGYTVHHFLFGEPTSWTGSKSGLASTYVLPGRLCFGGLGVALLFGALDALSGWQLWTSGAISERRCALETLITDTTRIHYFPSGMQNRTIGPYLAPINRITDWMTHS